MKHLSGLWHKLTLVVAVTAALSSCNRAEYAMLPKTTSYHGTAQRAVTVAPATKETAVTEVAPVAEAPVAVSEEVAIARPVEAPTASVAVTEAPAQAATAVVATPAKSAVTAPKLNLMQKALVQKIAKKADKLSSKMQIKQRTETAEAERLGGKLRQGIILVIVGLLVGLLGFVGGPIGTIFGIISTILVLVGIVLIVLYLLDEL
ncbi:hypothetical protein GCM10011375_01280 [Hymenobacter qilianensis]|uniref:Uncharacterized protein n=1 Tax=Hymenobacter qilianensis TaxID=1385715 RepID=A0ACB5PL52_9BACT|nr:hypothetical protein GCM10011375_01280 [Hymenobacter qilianensis]